MSSNWLPTLLLYSIAVCNDSDLLLQQRSAFLCNEVHTFWTSVREQELNKWSRKLLDRIKTFSLTK